MNKKGMVFLVTGVSIFIAIIIILIVWVIANSELNTNRNNGNLIDIDANGVTQNGVNNVGTLGSETNNNSKEKVEIKYTNNNLKINVEEQNLVYEGEINTGEGKPIKSTLKFEISGLKDKTVQAKINNEINGIIDFYRNHSCIVEIKATANFSDVLSVDIVVSNIDTANPAQRSIGLNYRLDNGEKLRLQDLFNSNLDARNAIKESLEKKIETYSQDLTKHTTSQSMQGLEISEIAEYDNNKEYDFSFDTKNINIYNIGKETDSKDVRYLTIELSDYFDKISIFTKYISKEYLYEETNEENSAESNENPAFLKLNKYSTFKKIDETTYVIQHYAGDVNTAIPAEIEKLRNQADYEADRIKKINTGHKLLVQDMLIGNNEQVKTKMITTNVYVVKADYFESEIFYNDLANSTIAQCSYIVDINQDYVILNTTYSSNEEL